MRSRFKRMIFIAPVAMLGIVLFMFLGGEIVKLLWNWLTPTVFGWRAITFWQAFGLLALCRILFGGRHFSVPRSTARQRIRQRMAERWEKMSPEERERWRQSLRGRCSSFEPPDSQPTA